MRPDSDALIETQDVSVTLGGTRILHDITMAVRPGEIVTIVGPNGSGKTTLLRVLTGAIAPTSGTVRRGPGLCVGYTPQRLAVDYTMPITVDRFLALVGGTSRDDRARIMEEVGIGRSARAQVAELSGGQLQRALLARAILRKPTLLVLDEPTQGLDQSGTVAFYRLIDDVRQATGCAVLMVSHDLHVVMSASDRVLCVNGHICCAGTPTVVSEAPEYRALFGQGTKGTLALYQHDHDHSHHDRSPLEKAGEDT